MRILKIKNYTLPTHYTLPQSITVVLNDSITSFYSVKTQPTIASVDDLTATQGKLIHLRDGEVVLFKIKHSKYWQARFKLYTHKWTRFSTRLSNAEDAGRFACDRYDESRYRERLGFTPLVKRFEEMARICIEEMRRDLSVGSGKKIYTAYIAVIETYFIPFFRNHYLTSITSKHIAEFEAWRDNQMRRPPKSSTLLTFASAFQRIHHTAIAHGWVSDKLPMPKLNVRGVKSVVRPAFTQAEIEKIRERLKTWWQGKRDVTLQVRLILRDYFDVLIYTGMRHGTEAMNLCWKHIEWHYDGGVRYLRMWVSGKTGERWLIAKHECVEALKRRHKENADVSNIEFERLIAMKSPLKVFRYRNGIQPVDLNKIFTRLLREMGIEIGTNGVNRTLYSLRHTYATLELLAGTDIHTLARQMGTSVVMLERHYSKLTATMAAADLA